MIEIEQVLALPLSITWSNAHSKDRGKQKKALVVTRFSWLEAERKNGQLSAPAYKKSTAGKSGQNFSF
jgi:hypothetical protein